MASFLPRSAQCPKSQINHLAVVLSPIAAAAPQLHHPSPIAAAAPSSIVLSPIAVVLSPIVPGEEEPEDLVAFRGSEGLTAHDVLDAPGEVVGKSGYATLYRASFQRADVGGPMLLRFVRPAAWAGRTEAVMPVVRAVGSVRLIPLCIHWIAAEMTVSVLVDVTTRALCNGSKSSTSMASNKRLWELWEFSKCWCFRFSVSSRTSMVANHCFLLMFPHP